jgi:hypothetical protein
MPALPQVFQQMKPVLKIDWATHDAARYACENWHYSRCIPKSKLSKVGVWENEKFLGVVIFGVGATCDLVKRYGLKMEQGCELVRIALRNHATPVSRIVAISLRFLKKANPGIRLVVSFADPEQGHHGGIYQAGGWIYSGTSQSSDEYIYKGKRWQGRSFRHKYKGMERHPSVQIVKGASKIRYLMPLDAEMKKQILPLAKAYPKRAQSIENDAPGIPAGGGRCESDLCAPLS